MDKNPESTVREDAANHQQELHKSLWSIVLMFYNIYVGTAGLLVLQLRRTYVERITAFRQFEAQVRKTIDKMNDMTEVACKILHDDLCENAFSDLVTLALRLCALALTYLQTAIAYARCENQRNKEQLLVRMAAVELPDLE